MTKLKSKMDKSFFDIIKELSKVENSKFPPLVGLVGFTIFMIFNKTVEKPYNVAIISLSIFLFLYLSSMFSIMFLEKNEHKKSLKRAKEKILKNISSNLKKFLEELGIYEKDIRDVLDKLINYPVMILERNKNPDNLDCKELRNNIEDSLKGLVNIDDELKRDICNNPFRSVFNKFLENLLKKEIIIHKELKEVGDVRYFLVIPNRNNKDFESKLGEFLKKYKLYTKKSEKRDTSNNIDNGNTDKGNNKENRGKYSFELIMAIPQSFYIEDKKEDITKMFKELEPVIIKRLINKKFKDSNFKYSIFFKVIFDKGYITEKIKQLDEKLNREIGTNSLIEFLKLDNPYQKLIKAIKKLDKKLYNKLTNDYSNKLKELEDFINVELKTTLVSRKLN